jgi:hypothetical protein
LGKLRTSLARVNKREIYDLLFWAATETLKAYGQTYLGGEIGITAVLHILRQAQDRLCMGCQTNIAQQIVDQEADCVLALKGNQGTFCSVMRPQPSAASRTSVSRPGGMTTIL